MSHPNASSPPHIALVGLAGAGKSAVARRLAERFDVDAVDVDHLITVRSGESIPTLFETVGESGFRDLETAALISVLDGRTRSIVATGGGVVERSDNIEVLRRRAHVVWLDVEVETLVARLRSSQVRRPLLDGDLEANVRRLSESRLAAYEALADVRVVVAADESVSDVADRVAELIEERTWWI